MKNKIEWKLPGLAKGVSAKKAYSELQKLDAITKESVLEQASRKDSVLHDLFEWDDSIAGHNYRLVQATRLINNFDLVTISDDTERKISAYEIVIAQDSQRVYKDISSLTKDEANEIRIRTIRELNYLKTKLSIFQQFVSATKKLDETISILEIA
jgi:hypothetical protein